MTADKPLGHDFLPCVAHQPAVPEIIHTEHCARCGKPKADHEPAMVPADGWKELAEASAQQVVDLCGKLQRVEEMLSRQVQRTNGVEVERDVARQRAAAFEAECKGWKAKAEELAKAESIATGWRESAQGWRALAEAGEKKAIDSHMALMDLIVKTRVASGDAGQIMAGDAALRKVMDAECRKAHGEGFEECREAAEKAAREHFGLVADADTRFGLIARLRGLVPK